DRIAQGAGMNDTFNLALLRDELTTDEGRRLQAYLATRGLVTIGIGRELTHKGISNAQCELFFTNDVTDCSPARDLHIPCWRGIPPIQQRVMINLCFMGWGSFSTFKKFLAAMQAHDFETAARELQNSRWWQQVRLRGPRVQQRLLSPSTTV